MQRQAFALELHHVQRLGWIVDQRQAALGRQCLDQLVEMLIGLGQAGDMADAGETGALQLGVQRLAMVDDMMGAVFAGPGLGFRARGGGDHADLRELTGQLQHDRTDAAGGTDDQQLLPGALAFHQLQALEQQLPGGDGGQRQCGGLGEAQSPRFASDDALVHQMAFAVAAGAGDGAGVEHLVADLEQADFAAHPDDHTGDVPAQHLRLTALGLSVAAYLGIHRVDRNGAHLHQQIARAGYRLGQFHVLQRAGIVDGEGFERGDRFHAVAPYGFGGGACSAI